MDGQCFLPFVPGTEVYFPNRVFFPSTDQNADDSPNLNIPDVCGVSIPAPLDQAPRLHIPHLNTISDSPTMTSPQYTPSPSFPSRGSRRLASTRSLPSYPEHVRSTYSHGHSLSDDHGRSSVRHDRGASSPPYRSTTQLPNPDQTYLRHRERSPYGPQVSPRLLAFSFPQDPHSISPQPDKFAQTSARYECTYCGKTFNRPSSLKTHTNTHTGEKRRLCYGDWGFASLQKFHFSVRLPSLRVWSLIQRSE